MATERTPEELERTDRRNARVQAVLNQTLRNITSWMLADTLDEPGEVCERWVDAMWNGLRDNLSPEDRLYAILMLLEHEASRAADLMLGEVP